MNNKPEVQTRRSDVETTNQRIPHPQVFLRRMQTNAPCLPVWATAPIEWREVIASDCAEDLRDRERIASLECIIALLIEKNERMRQQLALYMD
jgi:hypothetical protein